MALPSSPPLPCEPDLPTAPPPLLLPDHYLPYNNSTRHHRKRPFSDHATLSSDPIFSDAASDADSATDVDRPKRKRLIRGPWWHVNAPPKKLARKSVIGGGGGLRNADSGVWMGSDLSDESFEGLASSQRRLQELVVGGDGDVDDEGVHVRSTPPPVADVREVGSSNAVVETIVQHCLETNKEAVDLSGLGLEDLEDAALRPLHQLIRLAFENFTHPPSEDEYVPLRPSLKLFLSRNRLKRLPAELFRLENLTVLSLRSNWLKELPPAIARLKNLKELNVSGNELRMLPWALLDLIGNRDGRRQVTVRPNPLVTPGKLQAHSHPPVEKPHVDGDEDEEDITSSEETTLQRQLERRLRLGRFAHDEHYAIGLSEDFTRDKEDLVYLASSEIRYYAVDGSPMRRPGGKMPYSDEWPAILDQSDADIANKSDTSFATSLFEHALRSVQSHYDLPALISRLREMGCSPQMLDALRLAQEKNVGAGNETCTSCEHTFLIARAEWVEYWFTGLASQTEVTTEAVLPFLRRACSWRCAVPSQVGTFKS